MTAHTLVRALLERAIEDGLVEPARPEQRAGPDPQQFTDVDVQGCVDVLHAWLPALRADGNGE